jgi:hypothetical protein
MPAQLATAGCRRWQQQVAFLCAEAKLPPQVSDGAPGATVAPLLEAGGRAGRASLEVQGGKGAAVPGTGGKAGQEGAAKGGEGGGKGGEPEVKVRLLTPPLHALPHHMLLQWLPAPPVQDAA